MALVATPALAQPPGNPPNYPPAGAQQPGGLPLPPGYRPRTPPPAAEPPRPTAAPGTLPGGGSGGKVMYFQKPADALAATGAPDATAGGVARLEAPARAPVPVPDAPAATLPPPPPPSRYLPPDRPLTPPAVVVSPATPAAYRAQPDPKPDDPVVPPESKSLKQEIPDPPGGPSAIQLPPRDKIFTVYDDAQLEKAIIDRVTQDLLELNAKKDPKDRKTPAELVKLQNPRTMRFPPLPVISPPGVPYQPKTLAYEPRKVIIEPGYVVHRRLLFEEKNAERSGWDFGPLQTFVSAAYFYRDVLSLPHNVASGCVYGFWGTSAGKCLPGSPSPYYLYPPGLTLTGSVVEGAVLTGGAFLFP